MDNSRKSINGYGIIVYKYDKAVKQYKILLIERKNTLSYTEFMRGKYEKTNTDYIQLLINRFSIEEKLRILKYTFDELWKMLWINLDTLHYKIQKEYIISKEKYNYLIETNQLLLTLRTTKYSKVHLNFH